MAFPEERLRRLRMTGGLRKLTRETVLRAERFILPVFVVPGEGVRREVPSMPGVCQLSVDLAVEVCLEAESLGLGGVIIFGVPDIDSRSESGEAAWDPDGIVPTAVRAIKSATKSIVVMTDVCLCAYTSNGHCGYVVSGEIVNDPTLPALSRVALTHAKAGADVVAPSDMMDGRIGEIRRTLEDEGFCNTVIMSYAVKYASAFYGPFRDAAGSAPSFGDRRSHQMDPANRREALREAELDLEEGADIIMVKPALAYLDIVRDLKNRIQVPIAAYNVSGEYAMVKAAADRGWIDEEAVVREKLTSMVRAGADIVVTYHAMDMARWLRGGLSEA